MNMNICFQFDFDAVVDPNLHQKRSEKGKGKQGQRRQRKPSVASLAKEPASRQASDSHLGGRVTQAHRPAFSTGCHLRLKYFYRSRRAQPCHAIKTPPSAASSTPYSSSCCSSCGGARSSCRSYLPQIENILTHPYTLQALV